MRRILIIDGDQQSLAHTTYLLAAQGHRVATAGTAAEGWRHIGAEQPTLVVLRSKLPDGSGLEFVRRLNLREVNARAGSILLLGPDETEADRFIAMRSGADECLSMSASDEELVVRVLTLLRRVPPLPGPAVPTSSDEIYQVGPLWLNVTHPQASAQGALLLLRQPEHELLRCLMSQPGRIVSHEELRRAASAGRGMTSVAALRMHVCRLRTKLGAWGEMIYSVPPRGYLLRTLPDG